MESKVKLIIHGGAGSVPEERLKSHRTKYKQGLENALNQGFDLLKDGSSALETVCEAVKSLEDCPYFNAGVGSVLNENEKVLMEAMIMDGHSKNYGSILSAPRIKNPIEACKLILEEKDFNVLCGDGAVEFAAQKGLSLKTLGYFKTKYRLEQLKKFKAQLEDVENNMGTVGAVAIDQYGNIASATSTGGMCNTKSGRIGDSGLLGAGTYADNNTLAISCTGNGEYICENMVAIKIHYRIQFLNEPLSLACKNVFEELKQDSVGFIALDTNGHSSMMFNTEMMFRAWMDENSMEILI